MFSEKMLLELLRRQSYERAELECTLDIALIEIKHGLTEQGIQRLQRASTHAKGAQNRIWSGFADPLQPLCLDEKGQAP